MQLLRLRHVVVGIASEIPLLNVSARNSSLFKRWPELELHRSRRIQSDLSCRCGRDLHNRICEGHEDSM